MSAAGLRRVACKAGCCFVSACCCLRAAGHAGEDPAEKAAELKQLRQKIGALQSRLQVNREKKTRAEQRLQDAEQRINLTRRALRETSGELDRLGDQLAGLKAERQKARSSGAPPVVRTRPEKPWPPMPWAVSNRSSCC